MDDLIVVQTDNATLVASKSAEERVREAVKALEERELHEVLRKAIQNEKLHDPQNNGETTGG